MLYAVIVGCEIGFWALLIAGLACRYLLRRRRLGGALLMGVPLVDLVLLAASILDLRLSPQAGYADGIAAVYLGVSVAWGHSMVSWADSRFTYRFAGGPPPARPPKYGPYHARHERRQWGRHVLAWSVGCLLLLGGAALTGDLERSGALLRIAGWWTFVLTIDFAISFSYTLFPRAPRAGGA